MVFVAFFVPLAVYLLVLGAVNRRSRPLLVSGPTDQAGVVFAVSGFLVLGGPVVLASFHERWRLFWLLGEAGSVEGIRHAWQQSTLLSLAYFLTVTAGCGLLFYRSRRLTAIYNVEPADVEPALASACKKLGLDPVRSGRLLVIGLPAPAAGGGGGGGAPPPPPPPPAAGAGTVLALEPFWSSKHVTLRWEPHDSPLRPALEAELQRRLDQAEPPAHDTGLWLTTAGFGLLGVSLVVVFGLVLRSLLAR